MKLLLLGITCLSVFNCTKPARDTTLTVRLHHCSNTRPNLCFDSLNDSRCPANAICIWAGDGIARFRFTANAQHNVTLSTNARMGIGSDTTVEGHHLHLVDIRPFPGTGPADTVALVEIQ